MHEELIRPDVLGPALARALGDPRWERMQASLIAGGKSNLTFEVTSEAGTVVLRRPPAGPLLPRAHDMGREARVQRALAATSVPVPVILLEDTGELIGVPFYVMAKVDGYVVGDTLPAGYAESAEDRRGIADVLVDTLADLHAVDPGEVGLLDFGRPDGFGERQVRRWSDQWERSKSRDVPAVDELARRLRAHPPAGPGGAIVHGDYRLDNCLMSRRMPPAIAAVLDWELATLGALGAGVATALGALGALGVTWAVGAVGFGAASAIASPAAWPVSVTAVFAAATVFLAAAVASALVASCQARLAFAGISGSVACSRSSANLRWMASRCSAKS